MNEKNVITIFSYTKVWKIEKKIYSFQNVKMPVPINVNDALFFGGAFFAMFVLGKIFTGILILPVSIRLLAIPYGIMKLLRKKKLDGKNPVKYFWDYIQYMLFEKNTYIERFHVQPDRKEEVVQFNWYCSRAN